jgi:hypothetical protein
VSDPIDDHPCFCLVASQQGVAGSETPLPVLTARYRRRRSPGTVCTAQCRVGSLNGAEGVDSRRSVVGPASALLFQMVALTPCCLDELGIGGILLDLAS